MITSLADDVPMRRPMILFTANDLLYHEESSIE